MLNVYNYYMQDYVSRSPRYSTHKRRELRDIYKNIVTMSASEPLYKIDLSEHKQAHALSIKESALHLQEVTKKLKDTPLLHTAGLLSSAPETAEATLLQRMNLSSFTEDASYEVEVSALAAGQRNIGACLPSEETALPGGNYNFTASIGYESYSFRFPVSAGATAFDLQSKLADFINKTGIGLEAQVSYNKEMKISRLEIAAKQTGIFDRSSFTLEDTERPATAEKGLIETFGLNDDIIPAQNARYSVNGVSFESSENTVTYDGLMQLRLHSAGNAPATIRPIADQNAVHEVLEEFTTGYNRLIQAGKDSAFQNRSSAYLLRGLSHFVASHYSSLSSVGIVVDEEGYLTLDYEKAEQSAKSGDAEHLFQKDGSFLTSLQNRLETIVLNPMRFVDKKLVAYPNPTLPVSERTSPYTTSIYSGMLFNNYC